MKKPRARTPSQNQATNNSTEWLNASLKKTNTQIRDFHETNLQTFLQYGLATTEKTRNAPTTWPNANEKT